MVADFRRRFWVTLILTPPVLLLSPMIRDWLGLTELLSFPGDGLILFGLSTITYFYGGWPFLTGIVSELRKVQPGMMTLIALAISAAYFLSAAVTRSEERRVGKAWGRQCRTWWWPYTSKKKNTKHTST